MSAFDVVFDPMAFDVGLLLPNKYARMMLGLLPPGRVWRLLSDGLLAKLLAACADELGRFEVRALKLIDEDDPATIDELLPEAEAELDLASTGTTAERKARVLARRIARQRYRPIDLKLALAPLLGQLATDVVVIERTRAQAIAMGDDREIYRFLVYRNPALPGAYYVTAAQQLLDAITASHTKGYVTESISMLCDDPYSLCDRDVLGV